MRIAELARRADVAPSAVRWYEQVGVIPAPARRRNGYRDYDERDLALLRLVVALRRLGLDTEAAGRTARGSLSRGGVDLDVAAALAEQRAAIARRRDELDRLEAELEDLEQTIDAADRAPGRHGPDDPIRVLFVCTHNSARSQIAEALLSREGGSRFAVSSAGTDPRPVNPLALHALAEAGIDWSRARSKSVEGYLDQSFDYVVTVCDRARARCGTWTGAGNVLHWGLDDPAEAVGPEDERLEAFRRTRLELSSRLRPFIEIALLAASRRIA